MHLWPPSAVVHNEFGPAGVGLRSSGELLGNVGTAGAWRDCPPPGDRGAGADPDAEGELDEAWIDAPIAALPGLAFCE
jgi:hypothetical protein